MGFSLAAARRGYTLVAVHTLFMAVASLVVEHGLWGRQASVVAAHVLSSCGSQALEHRLNSCGARAQSLRCKWDFPKSVIQRLHWQVDSFTTEPPGKPKNYVLFYELAEDLNLEDMLSDNSDVLLQRGKGGAGI